MTQVCMLCDLPQGPGDTTHCAIGPFEERPGTPVTARFYMVIDRGNIAGGTRARHDTFDSAIDESERLARLHPGKTFVVLGAVCQATAEAAPIRREML